MSKVFKSMGIVSKSAVMSIILSSSQIALSHEDKASQEDVQKIVVEFLNNISTDNVKHVKGFKKAKNEAFAQKQTPRATVLMCSDSRVDGDAIDKNRVNDHFVIRNIGNQIETASGSVEYGINHLHTPVLLIVGHSGCGAIVAGKGDFSKESARIQEELKSLDVASTKSLEEGIIHNVNHQVEVAQSKFKEQIADGSLTVVGTVYDFRDDFKRGFGRLVVVNVNGETDTKALKEHSVLKNVKDVTIGARN